MCGLSNFVSKTIAEFTFALLMATAWNLQHARNFLQSGAWTQNQSTAFKATRLFGKTLGIVGLGAIGAHLAKRAAACDMRILYNKSSRLSAAEEFPPWQCRIPLARRSVHGIRFHRPVSKPDRRNRA